MEDVRDALLRIYSAALPLRLFWGGARVKRGEKCYPTRISLVFQYQKKKSRGSRSIKIEMTKKRFSFLDFKSDSRRLSPRPLSSRLLGAPAVALSTESQFSTTSNKTDKGWDGVRTLRGKAVSLNRVETDLHHSESPAGSTTSGKKVLILQASPSGEQEGSRSPWCVRS